MAALRRLGASREMPCYQIVFGCRPQWDSRLCFRPLTVSTNGVRRKPFIELCTPGPSLAVVHTLTPASFRESLVGGLCLTNSYSTWHLHLSAFTSSSSSASDVSKKPRDSGSRLHLHTAATTTDNSSASKVSKDPRDSDSRAHIPLSSTTNNNSEVSVKPRVTDTNDRLHFQTTTTTTNNSSASKASRTLRSGPGLEHFIANGGLPHRTLAGRELEQVTHPYVQPEDISGHGRKVYFDVYGCQMNVSDTEIAWAVLKNHGYARARELEEADVVLVMTCAIREGAEDKVWNKLKYLRSLKKKRMRGKNAAQMKIGVLGCMAERLKKKLVEQEKSVDVVAGPDSYRDLPRLLALVDEG